MVVHKGYIQTEEHRAKIREATFGHVVSEETKAKMRKSAQLRQAKKRLLQDPEKLKDTACSLCNEFALQDDLLALKRICRTRDTKEGCVIQNIWTRFLIKFERKT